MIESPRLVESARRARLRDFLHDCLASTAADQHARLRDAAELFDVAADRQDAFMKMLSCAAYESAALLILGEGAPFMLSRGGPGVCLAMTMLADGQDDATVEAATLALALLAAHTVTMLAACDEATLAPRLTRAGTGARLH